MASEDHSTTSTRSGRGDGGGVSGPLKKKRSRGTAEIGPIVVVDGYEKLMLDDGGFKRRKVGTRDWRRHCLHGRQRSTCKECGGGSICAHGRRQLRAKSAVVDQNVSTAANAVIARTVEVPR